MRDCAVFLISIQAVDPYRDSATNGPPKKLLTANASVTSIAVDQISA